MSTSTPDPTGSGETALDRVPTLYYQDQQVSLYWGNCLLGDEWLSADVLLTDPPYGRDATQRVIANKGGLRRSIPSRARRPIAGDSDTAVRDGILAAWGNARRALLFGDSRVERPAGTKAVWFYKKPGDSGFRGALRGVRRDVEDIYVLGPWPTGLGRRSSLFTTATSSVGGQYGLSKRSGHPHAKPLDVLADLLGLLGPGVMADPCAGSGNHLIAAKLAGRRAIGVEIDERHCANIAARLSRPDLFTQEAS